MRGDGKLPEPQTPKPQTRNPKPATRHGGRATRVRCQGQLFCHRQGSFAVGGASLLGLFVGALLLLTGLFLCSFHVPGAVPPQVLNYKWTDAIASPPDSRHLYAERLIYAGASPGGARAGEEREVRVGGGQGGSCPAFPRKEPCIL